VALCDIDIDDDDDDAIREVELGTRFNPAPLLDLDRFRLAIIVVYISLKNQIFLGD